MVPLSERAMTYAAATLARLIGVLPLNRVTVHNVAGRSVYHKRRRWYAPALIAAARLAPGRFVVLSGATWHAWERAVYWQAYGEEIDIKSDGSLAVPAQPGVVLATLLASGCDEPAALEACEAALRALARLHSQVITLPDGSTRPFSHGDATVANVTYDAAQGRAWWFDFETMSAPHRSVPWRQADDLRALLFSSASLLGPTRSVLFARQAVRMYEATAVLRELQAIAAAVRHRPEPLHLAQTHCSPHLARVLADALCEV
jgi:hypothetical protein